MKKVWILLLLCVFLAGCTVISAEEDPQPSQPQAATEYTEPESTELPDAGIAAVEIDVPQALTVTAQAPDATFSVHFTNVDLTGAPKEGRSCTLSLWKDGEAVTEGPILLKEDAAADFCVSYEFTRYMEQTSSEITLQLRYGTEMKEATIPVTLENAPDEVYAAASGEALPYAIDVIRNQNVVVVYGMDENGAYAVPVHVFLCSTGNATPTGNYSLGGRNEWLPLFHGVYGQYAISIYGDILFHSVPYLQPQKDTLETEEFNKLGTTASMGCVRMMTADVKWLYDYCPVGTPIHIYNADELTVEKPEAIILDTDDPRSGWDPTDPDENNPWRSAENEATP